MFWVIEVWTSELSVLMLVIVCELSASPASLFSPDWDEICPERPRIPKDHLQFKLLPSRKSKWSFQRGWRDHDTFTAFTCAIRLTPDRRCVSISVRRHRSVEHQSDFTVTGCNCVALVRCLSSPWEFNVLELRALTTWVFLILFFFK